MAAACEQKRSHGMSVFRDVLLIMAGSLISGNGKYQRRRRYIAFQSVRTIGDLVGLHRDLRSITQFHAFSGDPDPQYCNGRALDRVTKQKRRPHMQNLSKKGPKIVFSAPLENVFGHFQTFFGRFVDIPFSGLSNDLPATTPKTFSKTLPNQALQYKLESTVIQMGKMYCNRNERFAQLPIRRCPEELNFFSSLQSGGVLQYNWRVHCSIRFESWWGFRSSSDDFCSQSIPLSTVGTNKNTDRTLFYGFGDDPTPFGCRQNTCLRCSFAGHLLQKTLSTYLFFGVWSEPIVEKGLLPDRGSYGQNNWWNYPCGCYRKFW